MSAMPPEIGKSTREEREVFIREKFKCISDCESCGICLVYHGKDPVLVYKDYIDGNAEYLDIARKYR